MSVHIRLTEGPSKCAREMTVDELRAEALAQKAAGQALHARRLEKLADYREELELAVDQYIARGLEAGELRQLGDGRYVEQRHVS
jgi:hypothetical protein